MKRPLIVGNWKMQGDGTWLPVIGAIADAAVAMPLIDVALCLPATLIHRAATLFPSLDIGGQDCHRAIDGSYTGGIAASMIREAGGRLVLIGHSECRSNPSETDYVIAAKIVAAQAAGLRVIVCVGETGEDRAAGQAVSATCEQLRRSLGGIAAADLVVAYEPIWAIGGDHTPTTEEVHDVAAALRTVVTQDLNIEASILYGGSVTPERSGDLFRRGEIDGFLVGRASLEVFKFADILNAVQRERDSRG